MSGDSKVWGRRLFLAAVGGVIGASALRLRDRSSGTESQGDSEIKVSPYPLGRNQRSVNQGKSSWYRADDSLEKKHSQRLDNTGEFLRASGNTIAEVDDSDVRAIEMYPFEGGGGIPFEGDVIDLCLRNGYATAVTEDGWRKWRVNSGNEDGESRVPLSEEAEILSSEYGEVIVDPGEDKLISVRDDGDSLVIGKEDTEGIKFEPETACIDGQGRLCYITSEGYDVFAVGLSQFQDVNIDLVRLGSLGASGDGLDLSMASVNGSFYVVSSSEEGSSLTKLKEVDGGIETRGSQNLLGEQAVGRPVTNDSITVLNLGGKVVVFDTTEEIRPIHEVELQGEVENVELMGSGSEAKVFVYASGGTYEVDAETGESTLLEDTVYVDPFRTVRSAKDGAVVEYSQPMFDSGFEKETSSFILENGEHASRYVLRATDRSGDELEYQEEITRRLEPGETYRKPVSEIFDKETEG